jgi:murein DD-endopeptidase MepM/ murein hydrolase activator NlpD
MGNLSTKTFLFSIVFLLLSFIIPKTVFAGTWYFPMDNYYGRQTVKGFGDFIDNNFYKGKEALFPYNRFYGYHAAVDLETTADEKKPDTPVYAVYSGTIIYIGTLQGYGGVILEKLDGENTTALYGHVKIASTPFKIGDHITSDNKPVFLVNLGNEFSSETSAERKHLHFALHKGTGLYFHGHEPSLAVLNAQWFNPNDYLKEKGAVSPSATSPIPSPAFSSAPENNQTTKQPPKSQNIFVRLFNWIASLFK